MIEAVALLALIALILCGVHAGIALGLVGLLGIFVVSGSDVAFSTAASLPYVTVASYELAVIPLFILMGTLALAAGLVARVFDAVRAWAGHWHGGLGMTALWASTGLALTTGSGIAAAAVMAKSALPEMRRSGYDPSVAGALIACCGTLASLIPPSVLLIFYAILARVSIVDALLAGLLPGILSAVVYAVGITVWSRRRPDRLPRGPRCDWSERWKALLPLPGVLILALLVIGGLYAGIFGPSQVGGAAATAAFILFLIYRRVHLREFFRAVHDAVDTAVMVFIILIGSAIFARFLSITGLGPRLTATLADLAVPAVLLVLVLVLLYVVMGAFLEALSMMALTVPIVLPVLVELGYHPLVVGIFLVKMSEVATVTPPLGLGIYAVRGVAGPDVELTSLFRNVGPFVIMDLLTVGLIMALPDIVMILPEYAAR